MSSPEIKQAEVVTGCIVELRSSREEDLHLATYITDDGKRLRWVAPLDADGIEEFFVQLAIQFQNLKAIVMHPDDLKTYNEAMVGTPERIILTEVKG